MPVRRQFTLFYNNRVNEYHCRGRRNVININIAYERASGDGVVNRMSRKNGVFFVSRNTRAQCIMVIYLFFRY